MLKEGPNFDSIRQENVYGVEFWSARDLMPYVVGDQVRKTIEAIQGPMPEDLPSAPSIRALVEERRRQGKRLEKKQLPDEQEKLF